MQRTLCDEIVDLQVDQLYSSNIGLRTVTDQDVAHAQRKCCNR
jgi:hypothetical protein